MNWKRFLVTFLGVLLIIGGIFCLFTPITTFLTTGYFIGVLIFCDAIANIITWFDMKKYVNVSGWFLVSAIISAIFGIITIANVGMQFALDMFVVYLVCAWIITLAVSRIALALKIKKFNDALPNIFKNNRWIGLMLTAILMIIFAIICMIQPGIMSVVLGILIAWVIIFNGICLITISSYIPSK